MTCPDGGRTGIQPKTVCKFRAIHYYPSWFHHALTQVTITIAQDFFSLSPNIFPIWILQYSAITHLWGGAVHIGISPKRSQNHTVGELSILRWETAPGSATCLGSHTCARVGPTPGTGFLSRVFGMYKPLKKMCSETTSDHPIFSVLSRAEPRLRENHLLSNESA